MNTHNWLAHLNMHYTQPCLYCMCLNIKCIQTCVHRPPHAEKQDHPIYNHALFMDLLWSSCPPLSPLDLSSLSLWSFVFIHVHLLSPCFSYSLLWALLSLCYSTRFPLSLSAVPLFCISPTHFLSSWQAVCSSVNNNYGQCCKISATESLDRYTKTTIQQHTRSHAHI